jgi:hypothetical protein
MELWRIRTTYFFIGMCIFHSTSLQSGNYPAYGRLDTLLLALALRPKYRQMADHHWLPGHLTQHDLSRLTSVNKENCRCKSRRWGLDRQRLGASPSGDRVKGRGATSCTLHLHLMLGQNAEKTEKLGEVEKTFSLLLK